MLRCGAGVYFVRAVRSLRPIKHGKQPLSIVYPLVCLFIYPFSPSSSASIAKRKRDAESDLLATVVLATDTALERALLGMAPLVTNQVLGFRKVARAESTGLADSCAAAGAAVAAASSWCRHVYFWWHWRGRGRGRAGREGNGGALRSVCSSRVFELGCADRDVPREQGWPGDLGQMRQS